MRIFTCFVILLLTLSYHPTPVMAQDADYRFHPVFIYNFTKYIEWPAEKKKGSFVIGLLGESPIEAELLKMAQSRTIGSQKIEIRKFTSAADITSCHILFVAESSKENIALILSQTKGNATLVITEKEGMARKGSGINFVYIEDKLKYEINGAAFASAGIKVSKELTKLAIVI